MLSEATLREFYEHVYPVELITRWLSYRLTTDSTSPAVTDATKEELTIDEAASEEEGHAAGSSAAAAVATAPLATKSISDGYLARREFCFTLLGDVFTRFRSFGSAAELRSELIRSFPEKIDVGAVYNIRPNLKSSVTDFNALERELVFDIDMSDYDNVRSCCVGKSICQYCWAWMSCAAHVLRTVLEEDFGFRYLLPVFSGRRGVHLWVCDKRARTMQDDERAALVGYLTVVMPKTLRSSVVLDLANHRPIHPTIRHLLQDQMQSSFIDLFVNSSPENPNNMQYHPKAAQVVHEAVLAVLKLGRADQLQRFQQMVDFQEGNVLEWNSFCRGLGSNDDHARDVLHAVQLLLLYPRLDEHVSTRRDHLLKLPFCVHPGTSSLCCPLEWGEIRHFNPTTDAPKLDAILLERHFDPKFAAPLERMLQRMSTDPDELA